MSRDWSLYLDDIRRCCEKTLRYTAGMDFDSFLADELTYDAVMRNLAIIGEAAKNLPDDVRGQFPQVEWRKVAGFRDIAGHAYFSVDNAIVWDIVANKVPELLAALSSRQPLTQ